MKPINKDELFQNLSEFLKTRGIELKDGSYAQTIRASCSFLTDAINLGQEGLDRAKTQVDKQLDQMRQTIHEMTAPKPAPNPPTSASPPPAPPAPSAEAKAAPQTAKAPSKPKPKPKSKPKPQARKASKPRKSGR